MPPNRCPLTRRLAPVALLGLALHAHQRPQAAATQQVFRTGATLVTVDAVVTDKDGRQITDLTVDDFELIADGTRRPLRHVVYVPLGSTPAVAEQARLQHDDASRPAPAPAGGSGTAPSAIRRAPASNARVMAVVVDDLGLSFESTVAGRNSLKKFIDKQVEPGDQVAILRTAGGVGALQQFTADRRLMHAAADRIRWTVLVAPASRRSRQSRPRTRLDSRRARGVGRPRKATRIRSTVCARRCSQRRRSTPSSTSSLASRTCRAAKPWCSSPRASG